MPLPAKGRALSKLLEGEDLLDDFWAPDESDGPIITLRYFYQAGDAHLAGITLRREGIPSFVTHDNSQTILPTGQGWIGLNIREHDAEAAVEALRAADLWDRNESGYEFDWRKVLFILGILLLIFLLAILFMEQVDFRPRYFKS